MKKLVLSFGLSLALLTSCSTERDPTPTTATPPQAEALLGRWQAAAVRVVTTTPGKPVREATQPLAVVLQVAPATLTLELGSRAAAYRCTR